VGILLGPIRDAPDATLARWAADGVAALVRPVRDVEPGRLAQERAWVAEFLAAVRAEQAYRVAVPPARRA
jgi:hypothetical protein